MGGKLVDTMMPGGDDEDDSEAEATGSGRRMPVQQSMDVAGVRDQDARMARGPVDRAAHEGGSR